MSNNNDTPSTHIMLTRSKRKVGCNNDDKIIGIKNSNKKIKKDKLYELEDEWFDENEEFNTNDEEDVITIDDFDSDEDYNIENDIKNHKNDLDEILEYTEETGTEDENIEVDTDENTDKEIEDYDSMDDFIDDSEVDKGEQYKVAKLLAKIINKNLLRNYDREENESSDSESSDSDESDDDDENSSSNEEESDEEVDESLVLKIKNKKKRNRDRKVSFSEDETENEEDPEMLKKKIEEEKIKKLLFKYGYNKNTRKYFFNLKNEERESILKMEEKIDSINNSLVPLRFQLINSDIDINIKAIAIKKLELLENTEPGTSDYNKLNSWMQGFLKIPFGKYIDLPINYKNTKNEITEYIVNSANILDNAVYGHQKAKTQVLQIVGQWISNPQAKGNVFSIMGPMGNGKTTLVKEGIAKMINRPFEFISLGGATDASFLDGHSYTYEGSIPGKIVDILKKCKCMNPVIYFDELDKVSNTSKGEEIINLLIHLTDFSQNDHFMDKYYSSVPLDLSKALFIFSLNDLNKVNPILRDRMYMIETDKLKENDKIVISKKYIIPKIMQEIKMNPDDIVLDDEILKYIINKYSKEEGVRNLKRAYETIFSKVNLLKIVNLDSENKYLKDIVEKFLSSMNIKNIEFPLKINKEMIDKLVESGKINSPPFGMYT